MPLVASGLNDFPTMRHPGRVAIHVHLHEHRIEKLAFIEHHLEILSQYVSEF
jgi:hypothetical protein